MKLTIDIVKKIVLPELDKDPEFDTSKLNSTYWEIFTENLLDFKNDAKPLFTSIYSLGLSDPEKIISILEDIYHSLIEQLAENHVLGVHSKAIDYLLVSKNNIFEKEVLFLTNLEKAIKKVERKRIKQDLPKAFDRLTFELSDENIELAIKKKEREALREKMKAWDQELAVTEEEPIQLFNDLKETKVISLSWIKYAVAACFVLGVGVWFFNNQNQGEITENKMVKAPVKKDTTSKSIITPEIPSEVLAEVATVTKNSPVIESGLGFASNKTNLKIVENNQKARKASIVKALEKYRQLLENEFTQNKSGVDTKVKALESKINSLQNELDLLEEREKQYIFDGKALVMYVSTTAKENTIILNEDTYYLKRDSNFYKLTISSQHQPYQKVNDIDLIRLLDKILFENDL
jgi:HPt (histidine-containing phosphotransfer) domain-containing protein